MDTYLVQMNYPLLTVDYDPDAGVAHLAQSRFLSDPENADPDDDYRWFVPVTHTFVGGDDSDFDSTAKIDFFMRPEELELDHDVGQSDGLPIIFNIQAGGL